MQKSKIDIHPHELPDLIGDMKADKLQVPRFQRDFVWPLNKTRELLDSVLISINRPWQEESQYEPTG